MSLDVIKEAQKAERALRSFLRGKKCDDATIDEVAQETMLRVLQSQTSFDETKGSVMTWAIGIAKMILLERSRQSELGCPFDEGIHSPGPLCDEEVSEHDEMVLAFMHEFEKLKRIEQGVLRGWAESPNDYAKTLADQFKMKPGAIRATLIRAKKKIRKEMEERQQDHEFNSSDGLTDDSILELIRTAASRITDGQHQPVNQRVPNNHGPKIVDSIRKQTPPLKQKNAKSARTPYGPSYVTTGFAPLDTLLGGKGFVKGATVLLRGQAGTGKTTLSLQMAKHLIDAESHFFVFASVEDRPELLLNQITHSYWEEDFQSYLGPSDNWRVEFVTEHFDHETESVALEAVLRRAFKEEKISNHDLEDLLLADRGMLQKAFEEHAPEIPLRNAVTDYLRQMEVDTVLADLWSSLRVPENRPVFLVVDSLNALLSSASVRFRTSTERQLLQSIMHSFKQWRYQRDNEVTVLFLVEDDDQVFNAAASYVADTVIDLRPAMIEQTVYERSGTDKKPLIQELRYCRVLKGRGLPIQRRSCCYEFVKSTRSLDSGIKFFPTYATPGVVSLFFENRPMKEVIANLRDTDVPVTYPQVIVQEFSRSALQRIFSVQRHSSRISQRHPLMLSNVDEHWLDVLRHQELLQPIPIDKLQIFPLSFRAPSSDSLKDLFIPEIWNTKGKQLTKVIDGQRCLLGIPQIANVGMLVYRKDILEDLHEQPPRTWEDIERICRHAKNNGEEIPYKFRLETQSYDSFLATALELIWGHGGFQKRGSRLDGSVGVEINFANDVPPVVAALVRIKYWIHEFKIVPLRSTVDPDLDQSTDWLFARHWYSTWVDVMTRKLSFPNDSRFGVLPIPIAHCWQMTNGNDAIHNSAWGEWYLAIQRGSENIELGIDLINNLMTSRKITERALAGAALPTVEKFYALTDEICPYTDLTFTEVRELLFRHARSRTELNDYPLFARVFSGALRTIATNPKADVIQAVKRAFKELYSDFIWPESSKSEALKLIPDEMHRCLT